jgi:hypothetical protein
LVGVLAKKLIYMKKNIFQKVQAIVILTIIAILFINCKNFIQNDVLKVEANKLKKINSKEFQNSTHSFYSVDITLLNTTDSVVSFKIMTCSWQENFIFNVDNIHLYEGPCDSNYPEIKQILPHQKIVYRGIVKSLNNFKMNKLKLGFVLIYKSEVLRAGMFESVLSNKINKKENIIWSNEFMLK